MKYIPGHRNIADVLSRLSIQESAETSCCSQMSEDFVRFVALQAVPKAVTIQDVEKESAGDFELCRIREA